MKAVRRLPGAKQAPVEMDVWKKLKHIAVTKGKHLNEIVNEALEQYVAHSK